MLGWLTDTFRLVWDALALNVRKSWHIVRGRHGRCPCQIVSDSGRAWETGCETVIDYRSPARFRTVCPLLARRPDGAWVCSANSEDVRPFWGRGAVLLGGALLASLGIASLAVFGLLRGIGYEVRYSQLVWPPAWRELRSVQADFYLGQARTAYAAGDIATALLHLSNAYELNPADYQTGLLLAQLWQAGQPLFSDQTYARLLTDHPQHREEIAQAWFRALLARGDFRAVQRLAGERLLGSGAAPSPAWIQAFLFATRQLGDIGGLQRLLEDPALPPALAPLLGLEARLHSLAPEKKVEALHAAATASRDAFTAYHLQRRLLDAGRGDLVLRLSTASDSPLGDREKARLRLDALGEMGRDSDRLALARQLLAQPTHPAICELLSGHLISYPHPGLLAAYAAKLEREPLPAGDARYPQLLGFFTACGVHRDADLLDTALGWVNQAAGRDFRTLTAVRDAFLDPESKVRLESFLPALQPLPLEITYALFEHYAPPAPPSRRGSP